MPRMTGGEALAKQLQREGVRVVFGLPGVQLYGAMAALREEKDIRFVPTRHEQATTLHGRRLRPGGRRHRRRAGRARAGRAQRRRPGSALPTRLVAGVPGRRPGAEALSRQGRRRAARDQRAARRRQADHQVAQARAGGLGDPCRVHEAFRQLKTGRPRPVHLEIPPDTLEDEGEAELLPPVHGGADGRPRRRHRAGRARAARRPARRSSTPAAACTPPARTTRWPRWPSTSRPASSVRGGQGRGDDRSDLSLGAASGPRPAREYADAADVVLASAPAGAGRLPAHQQIVQIDVDGEEIGRNHPVHVGLVGDARATLERLLERLRDRRTAAAIAKGEREQCARRRPPSTRGAAGRRSWPRCARHAG